jgi:hypothetical protein
MSYWIYLFSFEQSYLNYSFFIYPYYFNAFNSSYAWFLALYASPAIFIVFSTFYFLPYSSLVNFT